MKFGGGSTDKQTQSERCLYKTFKRIIFDNIKTILNPTSLISNLCSYN